MSEKQIFTLKQVVSSIKKTIDDRYKMAYWVKAEMHKLNRFPSGHCFPELLQKEDGKIVAQLSGTIWRTVMERVNKSFLDLLKGINCFFKCILIGMGLQLCKIIR